MTRRTGHSLNDLIPKGPLRVGSKIGTATVIAVSGMDGAARAERGRAEGKPWGRFVAGDSRRVVLAFSLPHKDLSVNGPKGKWRAKGKATKEAVETAELAAADAIAAIPGGGFPWEKATAAERWFFPDCRGRDGRNAEARMKAIYDGLVRGGLLVDDDTRHLSHLPSSFDDVDRKDPRVLLTLERC